MAITKCGQCAYHIPEFFRYILCRYKTYPKLYIFIEAEKMKNSVPCPKEGTNRRNAEEYESGPKY